MIYYDCCQLQYYGHVIVIYYGLFQQIYPLMTNIWLYMSHIISHQSPLSQCPVKPISNGSQAPIFFITFQEIPRISDTENYESAGKKVVRKFEKSNIFGYVWAIIFGYLLIYYTFQLWTSLMLCLPTVTVASEIPWFCHPQSQHLRGSQSLYVRWCT